MLRSRRTPLVAGVVIGLGLLSACSSGGSTSSSASTPSSDPNATVTVWVDDARVPAVKAFIAANPTVKVNLVTKAGGTAAGVVTQAVALANKAGTAVPDVVFLSDPGDVASLAVAPLNYAQPLNDLVPQTVRDGFAPGTLSNCTYDGKVYCLQNDIAQGVLWYNAKLMKKFGYAVPTTWEEYQAIGVKVATEHPGYLVGGVSGRDLTGILLGSSGCPSSYVTDPESVTIKLSDPTCTRMTDLLNPLIKNKTVQNLNPWDATFIKKQSQKVLMYPNASWFGDFGFNGAWKTPKGEIAAAPMPTWAGAKATAGVAGGGVWVVSNKSKNIAGAAALATYVTTDMDVATADSTTTYPAFTAAATAWCAKKATDAFYASDPCPAMKTSAANMTTNQSYIRYLTPYTNAFNSAVTAAAGTGTDGKGSGDLTAAVVGIQKQLESAAADANYSVSQ